MYQYRLVDDNGLFVEDIISKAEISDPHYIATPCPGGFYWPRWDGEKWVEGGSPPEPVVTVEQLKQRLSATDYRIIKCYEYQLMALPLPYRISELHAEREALREQIRQMEGE